MRIQVEAYGLARFTSTISDSESITIKEFKQNLEQEILEIYNWKTKVAWIKDDAQNDLNPKHKVKELLTDMAQVYIFLTFESDFFGNLVHSKSLSNLTIKAKMRRFVNHHHLLLVKYCNKAFCTLK
jgi:ABC-type dipeptide/oligopeptide/nickel transport system ATPase component